MAASAKQAQVVGPVLEDTVYRDGVLAVQGCLGTGDLLVFPKRANGTTLLLRESFYQRLFDGRLDLEDFQASDISAAQADIRHLNVTQLLYIRCQSLSRAAAPSGAQTEFLNSVAEALDQLLMQHLATQEDGDAGPPPEAAAEAAADARKASEVVRLVALIYGAQQQLQAPAAADHWLVRLPWLEACLHLPSCTLRRLPEDAQSTFCHRNLSTAVSTVPKHKKMLHWEVEMSREPASFKSEGAPRASTEKRRGQSERFAEKICMGAARRANPNFVGGEPGLGGYPGHDAQVSSLQSALKRLEQNLDEERAQRTADLAAFQERYKVQLAKDAEAKAKEHLERAEALATQLKDQEERFAAELAGRDERCAELEAQLEQQRTRHEEDMKAARDEPATQLESRLEEQRARHEEEMKAARDALTTELEERFAEQRSRQEEEAKAERDELSRKLEEQLAEERARHEEAMKAERDELSRKLEEQLAEERARHEEDMKAKDSEHTAQLAALEAKLSEGSPPKPDEPPQAQPEVAATEQDEKAAPEAQPKVAATEPDGTADPDAQPEVAATEQHGKADLDAQPEVAATEPDGKADPDAQPEVSATEPDGKADTEAEAAEAKLEGEAEAPSEPVRKPSESPSEGGGGDDGESAGKSTGHAAENGDDGDEKGVAPADDEKSEPQE